MKLLFTSVLCLWSTLAMSEGSAANSGDEPVKTRAEVVEVIDEEEFPDTVRQLPKLVEKIQVERAAADNPYLLLPHRPNYVMPFTYQTRPNEREVERLLNRAGGGESTLQQEGYDHVEAVFQLSIKYLLAENLLGRLSTIEVGYTNRSFWQAYNSDISKPFRETNHEPELMFSWQLQDHWLEHVGISLNHQSNGQTSSLSRSWNRVIFEAASIAGKNIWYGRAWWRVPEERDGEPFDPSDNDNPDIDDYLGHGELYLLHPLKDHTFTMMVRNNFNWSENRGAVEINYSFPLTNRLKGFVQYFNGYGESLIDYNVYQERIGFGIKLSDWI
ncbi:phospholipase [Bacterioplanes sanyensis]|uniref:Phospholipase A1 n=1 Tax=Bacterioplanes sanyensis TaxID=1249553 RepID=A0A222FPX7_9GAMM|nr:phospholipase A [Bacterioplanes sanyensis]ASP40451.1 phospholipase [Bacterioplanes sanyensis]